MTHDTDFIRLHMGLATPNIPLKKLGLEWPPPERLYLGRGGEIREARDDDDETFIMVRTSYSSLDDETASHVNIARGAQYSYLTDLKGNTQHADPGF